jgi:hypothetical protein
MFDPTPLQNFMARARKAANTNAKEIRITTEEALDIAACLVQIISAQVAINVNKKPITIKPLDGGTF